MIDIILVRHGETEWNTSGIFRGRADIELSETGIRQAELLAGYLSSENIDVVYSSPLQRAVQTAGALAGPHSLRVNTVPNLIDMDFGEWQGLSIAEVQEKYPDIYRDWLDTPEQVRIPGGESLEDVKNRALPFLEDAVIRCGEGTLAIVSHRVVLKVLICALLRIGNAGFPSIKLDTGGISRFRFDGNLAILTGHNDTSFLRPIGRQIPADF